MEEGRTHCLRGFQSHILGHVRRRDSLPHYKPSPMNPWTLASQTILILFLVHPLEASQGGPKLCPVDIAGNGHSSAWSDWGLTAPLTSQGRLSPVLGCPPLQVPPSSHQLSSLCTRPLWSPVSRPYHMAPACSQVRPHTPRLRCLELYPRVPGSSPASSTCFRAIYVFNGSHLSRYLDPFVQDTSSPLPRAAPSRSPHTLQCGH